MFCLALVVPLFTVAMKLLMRTELKYYYSTAYQANRRHPEAWSFEISSDRLKERAVLPARQPIPDEPAPRTSAPTRVEGDYSRGHPR